MTKILITSLALLVLALPTSAECKLLGKVGRVLTAPLRLVVAPVRLVTKGMHKSQSQVQSSSSYSSSTVTQSSNFQTVNRPLALPQSNGCAACGIR